MLEQLGRDDSTTPVVTARRLSPGAKELLNERGIAWADAAGFAEIADPSGLYVSRLRPKPLPQSVTSGMTWSRTAETIVEFILSRRAQMQSGAANGIDRVAYIAEATNVSTAQVSKVLIMLDEEGYTAKFGPERGPTSVRELRDASRLLSDWAGHYKRATRRVRRVELHVPWRSHSQSIGLADNTLVGHQWAVSGWVAADAIASFTTHVPDLTLYAPEDDFELVLERLTSDPDVTEVDHGGRIHLRAAGRYLFEFTRMVEGVATVSPVRVYADLIRSGDRGVEAAEHLREVAIGF
ncbi:MAG: hypothetical protein IT190_04255 [Microbacteriaceae bacterium]|nr:hypothetical protein [Microbacteriaceae bacterium]